MLKVFQFLWSYKTTFFTIFSSYILVFPTMYVRQVSPFFVSSCLVLGCSHDLLVKWPLRIIIVSIIHYVHSCSLTLKYHAKDITIHSKNFFHSRKLTVWLWYHEMPWFFLEYFDFITCWTSQSTQAAFNIIIRTRLIRLKTDTTFQNDACYAMICILHLWKL